jgi:hypothetical protein
MKYAVKVGLGAMIYILSFIKIGLAIPNLIEGNTQTHRQGDIMSNFNFFK